MKLIEVVILSNNSESYSKILATETPESIDVNTIHLFIKLETWEEILSIKEITPIIAAFDEYEYESIKKSLI